MSSGATALAVCHEPWQPAPAWALSPYINIICVAPRIGAVTPDSPRETRTRGIWDFFRVGVNEGVGRGNIWDLFELVWFFGEIRMLLFVRDIYGRVEKFKCRWWIEL